MSDLKVPFVVEMNALGKNIYLSIIIIFILFITPVTYTFDCISSCTHKQCLHFRKAAFNAL